MNGGVSSKIGHWYEEAYPVWQALRLLDETIEELVWEGRDEDERGIDLWIRELGGGRVAIQCKTRSSKRWTVRHLVDERIFEHARFQLAERPAEERAGRYEFVTNERAHEWESAIEDARAEEDLAPHQDVVAAIGEGAPELLRRMKVRIRDQESIEDDARTIARTLVPHPQASRLVDALRETLRTRLRKTWTKATLQGALESFGFEWIDDPTGRRFGEMLARITDEFVEHVARSRLLSRHLDRPEEDSIASAALTAPRGSLVLVRGAPGAGKSEVLARLVGPARSAGATILALNADELSDLDLPNDLPARLRILGGDADSLLVLDQVDQLARGGARYQSELRPIERLVDAARRAGLVVVVGCRTIEASRVTQLENLFGAPGPGRHIDVEVGDLPEAGVAEVLQERGIPLADLTPEMRRLVRRPIVLSLLARLVDRSGGWRGVRSQHELIERWCESLREDVGAEAIAALDSVAERMDADGTTSVDRSTLTPPTAVDALVAARILVETSAGRVRPFHQVVTDTRLALRVASDVGSTEELRDWIGDRSAQDLHKARRLRLATTVLAARDGAGARMLGAILDDDSVRPLTKHAVLMGLAAVDEPSRPLVDLVRALLDDERRRATVARTVVYDHEGWMDALEEDLDRYWETWPEHRDLLLQLLAAISVKRGQRVTEHLLRWQGDDPDLLDRARLVFWHDPSEDCDAQFEMRLQSPFVGPDSYPIDWSEFMAKMPVRAIRLLVESLKRTSREGLTGPGHDDRWMFGWPSGDSIPEEVLDLGAELLEGLQVWWADLDVSDVEAEGLARYGSEDVTLVRVLDLLARACARSIALGALDWTRLVEWAPPAPRMLDAWMFLRVGASLGTGTPEATADDAAAWFERDPAVTELLRDAAWAPRTSRVAREFLLGVAEWASHEVAERLRAWADELPDVPEPEVRSLPAVEPAVPVAEASKWTPDEWVEAFRRAGSGDDRWQSGPDGRPVDRSRAGLAESLSRCASRDPERFLEYAREFTTRERALPAVGRQAILEGLSSLTLLDRVEPSALESLILRPEYRNARECSGALARCVHDRADHDWSDSLLRRLGEIADEHAGRNTSRVALHALARVAEKQPARRAIALDVVEPLIDHPEATVRAGSAEVAIVARSADPALAIGWVLRAAEDSEVASDARVAQALRWVAVAADETGESASLRARDLLASLARSSAEEAAALGGASLLFLLHHGVTSQEAFEEITTSNLPARLGAARTLASWLNDDETEATDRMKDLALSFANDDDPQVRGAILGAFLGRGESPLLDDRSFLAEIVRSKAVGNDKGSLLRAFDRRGTLLPLEEEVRALATRLLDPQVSAADPWLTRHHSEKACEMLSRLIEEAEREGRPDVRDAALDAWDALLEAAVPAALSTLSTRLDGSEGPTGR